MRAPPDASEPIDPNCGYWRKPWSVQVQSHWLEALFKIALSKPHVDSVAWHDLVDHDDIELPMKTMAVPTMMRSTPSEMWSPFRSRRRSQAP